MSIVRAGGTRLNASGRVFTLPPQFPPLPMSSPSSVINIPAVPDDPGPERIDRVGDLLLRKAAHPRDQLCELDEVGIEDSGGVLGNIHVVVCKRWRLCRVRATLLLAANPRHTN